MELFIFARFHARKGRENALAAMLQNEVRASLAEPGCIAHNAYRSTKDPNLFFIHSRWVDEATFDKHIRLPHTVRFAEQVQHLIDHDLDVTRTHPIGTLRE